MKEFKSRILRSLKSLPSPSPNFAIPASASPKSFLLHPFQLIKQFHNDYDDDDNNKENSLRADDQMILSDPQPPDGEDAEDASTTKQAPSFRRPNPHSQPSSTRPFSPRSGRRWPTTSGIGLQPNPQSAALRWENNS
uniref:Uncharacterized protein n=1 Tax=Ananas comosus var. bracteatus TaxID=296719 RepID=A0A6V7NMJ7_ANACO|nr:unnamed protein product [Ananas comosus var. bracteatus]